MHPKPTASLVKDAPLRPCSDDELRYPGLIRATAEQSTAFESEATVFESKISELDEAPVRHFGWKCNSNMNLTDMRLVHIMDASGTKGENAIWDNTRTAPEFP